MADLIATARMLAFEAQAIEEEADDDWDELEGGPEIIYAYGNADTVDDDEDDVE